MAWYKKLAIHLLQQSLLNAHIMYAKGCSQTQPKLSFLQFTNAVVKELLKGGPDEDFPDTPPYENILHLGGRHFPMKIPTAEGQKKAMKRCKVCYQKEKIRTESRYTCNKCPSKPGLYRQWLRTLSYKAQVLGIDSGHIYSLLTVYVRTNVTQSFPNPLISQ